MGLTRKIMSVSTLGAVDMRSDKERIARKTAKAARYEKKSYQLLKDQAKAEQASARVQAAPVPPPATAPAAKPKSGLAKVFGAMSAGASAKFMENASPEIRAELERQADPTSGEEWVEDATPEVDLVEGLVRLTSLHESGALSDAEFEAAKARLLGQE